MEKEYVDFPLIRENSLEKRLYQETIFNTAANNNTLCVLPTGMGKTFIAVLLAAYRMNKLGGKILFMAPTRPLVEQHKKTFNETLEIAGDDMKVLTGKVRPGKREKEYKKGMCIFATPQCIKNDIIAGRVDLNDFTLMIFDESHRAVKDYPYPFIAEMYMKKSENSRILALTASPGGERKKIDQVKENLYIDEVEIRTEEDSDVRPYIQDVDINWIEVHLPEEFENIRGLLKRTLKRRYKKLKKWEFTNSTKLGKRDLLDIQERLRKILATERDPNPLVYQGISKTAEALKIEHSLMLLETQGLTSFLQYMKRLRQQAKEGKTRAAKSVMKDGNIEVAYRKANELIEEGVEHPKLDKLQKVVMKEYTDKEDSKIIVFSHYRDSVDLIKEKLGKIKGCKPYGFVGQAGESGLSQSEQVEILDNFREGKYNCIISTAVGEEGLDIPAVDSVIFYEPVPSEIRAIQRRGRTGRQKSGKVTILMTKDTRDEGYYWKAKHRERKMKGILKNMRNGNDEKEQKTLGDFEG
ncbi:MAG: helicase-related protein [Candidatus Aenigmatarchaeota archaeon]